MNLIGQQFEGRRFRRLVDAKHASRKASEQALENYRDLRKQYVGKHGPDKFSTENKVPINLLEMLVQINTRNLASNNPKVMVNGKFGVNKSRAADIEADINQIIKEIDLAEMIRMIVVDAHFLMGICKVAINEVQGSYETPDGSRMEVMGPTACRVSPEDWVHDSTAFDRKKATFTGDRYIMALEDVKEGPFDPKITKHLVAANRFRVDPGTDYDAQYDDENWSDRHFVEQVELWDLWLPRERLIVTMSDDFDEKPLRVVEWDGPETGPYHLLCFEDIPDEFFPLAPGAVMKDLHLLANTLFNKAGRQATRSKVNHIYSDGAAQDAERLKNANDGEYIRSDQPGAVNTVITPGVDQTTLAFTIQVQSLFKEMGGNLDVLGGLGPQSETLGQDQLITAAASKRMQDMQARTIKFTKSIVTALAHFVYTDPLLERTTTREVADTGIEVPVRISPETIGDPKVDYLFDVDPYSMQYQTPAQKMNTLMQTMGLVQQLLPFMQQQGITLKVEEVMRLVSRYTHFEELDEILSFVSSDQVGPQGGSHGPNKPPVTKRVHERINRPGATNRGRDQILMQHLSGGKLQDSEKAVLNGSVK